jgi:hypothetical protein
VFLSLEYYRMLDTDAMRTCIEPARLEHANALSRPSYCLRNIKTVNLSIDYVLLILIENTTTNKMVGSKSAVVRRLERSNKTDTTSLWL